MPRNRPDGILGRDTGMPLKAWGKITAWDDLFKKATLDAV